MKWRWRDDVTNEESILATAKDCCRLSPLVKSLLPIQSMTNFVYVGTKGHLSPRVRGETQAGRESCENTIGIDLQDA